MLQLLTLLGSLSLFLYGMMILSNGLQKSFGDKIRILLPEMVSNPFKQILAGFGLTTAIQSSRAATVMVVSLVNAGLLTLAQAVGVIFGANIGTTVTAWLITVFGFTFDVRYVGFPLLAIGFFFMISNKKRIKIISEIIIGVALVFIGIWYLKETMDFVSGKSLIMNTILSLGNHGFLSVIIFLFWGIVISALLRSSSATIAITLILLSFGWITFAHGAAIVFGANIGTTITANFVAIRGNILAKRAALIHFLFNTIGVIIVLIFFNPFISLCNFILSIVGCNSLTDSFIAGVSPIHFSGLLYGICLIHTLFNLIVAIVLIGFNKLIVKAVTILIVDKPEKDSHIKYINTGLVTSPSISISQAYREIINFGNICYEGFGFVKKAVNEQNPDIFEDYRKKLVDYENLTDKMEAKIATFLNHITTSEINEHESQEIKVLYRVIGELESLGDSCDNISRILNRERLHKRLFDTETIRQINLMIDKVDYAYKIMILNIQKAANSSKTSITEADSAEIAINECRNKLRDIGISNIEKQIGNYQSLNYFLDIISELEAMGDFIINISQSLCKCKS